MCAVYCLTRSTRTRVRALLVGLLQYANTPYSDATTDDEKRVMTTTKGTASAHGDSASHPLKNPKEKPKSKPKPPVAEEGKKEAPLQAHKDKNLMLTKIITLILTRSRSIILVATTQRLVGSSTIVVSKRLRNLFQNRYPPHTCPNTTFPSRSAFHSSTTLAGAVTSLYIRKYKQPLARCSCRS